MRYLFQLMLTMMIVIYRHHHHLCNASTDKKEPFFFFFHPILITNYCLNFWQSIKFRLYIFSKLCRCHVICRCLHQCTGEILCLCVNQTSFPLESMFSVIFIAVSVGENEMVKEERIRRLWFWSKWCDRYWWFLIFIRFSKYHTCTIQVLLLQQHLMYRKCIN